MSYSTQRGGLCTQLEAAIFFTPFQLFDNPELLFYNPALTPSYMKQGCGTSAKL